MIKVILALNHATRPKEDARRNSRGFSRHQYGGTPPVPSTRTHCQELRLIKYFHLAQRIRDPTSTTAENAETPPLREIWRRNLGEEIIWVGTRIIGGQGIIPLIIKRSIFIAITNPILIQP
jgi:hypothetical protein